MAIKVAHKLASKNIQELVSSIIIKLLPDINMRLMRFKTMDINKNDFNFLERLSDWQEKYIEGFIKEYVSFLNDDIRSVSEKFCELEKQIGVLMKIGDFIFKFKSLFEIACDKNI